MKRLSITISACFIIAYTFSQPSISIGNKDSLHTAITVMGALKDTNLSIKPGFKIYPNPAKNKISISVNGFDPGIAVVKITDFKGNALREDNRLLTNGNEEMVIFFSLQPGIYFLTIRQKEKIARKKLVVI